MNQATHLSTPPVDGRSSRWDEHRAARRRELLRAVRGVLHDEGPEVSMDAIAQRTGSSKTVFYRYFGDRNGLQDAVGEWAITVIGRHLAQASERPDRLRAMVAAFVDLAAGSPAVYTFAAGSTPVAGGGRQSETMLAGVRALLLEAARPAGLDEVAAQEWAAGAIGFVRGCVDAWLAEAPSEQDRRREAEALADRITTWLSMTITAPGA